MSRFLGTDPGQPMGGKAKPDREIILQALDDSPESISFRDIIECMDTRYWEWVSEEAAEQRWASLPLLGPEEHQLVQYWTNWNKLGRGVTASGRRQRMVFLTSVSKHHSALIAPKEGGGGRKHSARARTSPGKLVLGNRVLQFHS